VVPVTDRAERSLLKFIKEFFEVLLNLADLFIFFFIIAYILVRFV